MNDVVLTRVEVLAARKTVCDFLRGSERRKAKSVLDRGNGYRCCLGHMSYALKIQRKKGTAEHALAYGFGALSEVSHAPQELVDMVGLWNDIGDVPMRGGILGTGHSDLASINDETDKSPQEIGAYLESVIEGGDHTPWKPLTDYPE